MHRRKGYILLAVLGIAVIVTALGLSFVESHSTAMPESANRYGAMRAQYLAESGIAIGSHFLMYPPTTVALDQYYTGANNVAVDASSDYTNISVVRSDSWSPAGTDLNLYRITGVGVAYDPDGSVRGKRQVTAEVIVPEMGKVRIPYACFDTSNCIIPSGVALYGDLHANGNITGQLFSYCNGKISSTGSIMWLGTRNLGYALSPSSAAYVPPSFSASKYSTYTIRGNSYSGLVITDNDISKADADALNATSLTSTNPGRVIIYKGGDITIRANVSLLGTLVTTAGDVLFRDAGSHVITAVKGFPAIVSGDDVAIKDADVDATITGSVFCVNTVNMNSHSRSNLIITGTLLKGGSISAMGSNASLKVTWDQDRSWLWDLDNSPSPQPITVLNWKED